MSHTWVGLEILTKPLSVHLIEDTLWKNWAHTENNIKTNLKETEWEVVDWIYLAQDRGP